MQAFLATALVLLLAGGLTADEPSTSDIKNVTAGQKNPEMEWTSLFNGENLGGWKVKCRTIPPSRRTAMDGFATVMPFDTCLRRYCGDAWPRAWYTPRVLPRMRASLLPMPTG